MVENSREWWAKRRWSYTRGLLFSGVAAFLCYLAVLGVFSNRFPCAEVTIFTTLFQGIGYLLMVLIANVIYSMAPVVERNVNPSTPERWRERMYWLGSRFSYLLPFLVPLVLVVLAIVGKTPSGNERC